jgi:hypothetical protein
MGRYTAIKNWSNVFFLVRRCFSFYNFHMSLLALVSHLRLARRFLVVRYGIVNPNEIAYGMF